MRKCFLFTCLMSLLFLASHSTAAADDLYLDEWSVGSGKFKIGGAWLYWQMHQDNLEAADIVRVHSESGARSCRPVSINQKWNSGFRVNVGYEFCDCWELGLIYTDLPHRSHSRHHRLENDIDSFDLSSGFYFSHLINPANLNALRTKWRSDLSWLDLDISRTVCFGECFTIRPHVGFRTLWNNRRFHVHGEFANPDSAVAVQGASDPCFVARLRDDLTGYGAEGGLWANYELGCGLSIVGHFGGSILYAKHRTHQGSADANFFLDNPSPGVSVEGAVAAEGEDSHREAQEVLLNPVHWRHSQFFGVPTMDYLIGVQYESTFCDFILTTTLAWEQHVFRY